MWLAAVRESVLLSEPQVLHLYDDRLLYLDRYWREEKQVCDDLLALHASRPTSRHARLSSDFSRPGSKNSEKRRKSLSRKRSRC